MLKRNKNSASVENKETFIPQIQKCFISKTEKLYNYCKLPPPQIQNKYYKCYCPKISYLSALHVAKSKGYILVTLQS